jgi:hypothetical protein
MRRVKGVKGVNSDLEFIYKSFQKKKLFLISIYYTGIFKGLHLSPFTVDTLTIL